MQKSDNFRPPSPVWTLETIKHRIQAGIHLRTPRDRAMIVDIGNHILVKYGSDITPHEGMVTQYVAAQATGIPIPKIYAIVYDEVSRWTYIVQEKLPGVRLITLLPTLDANTRSILATELNVMLRKLSVFNDLGPMGLYGKQGQYHGTCIGRFLELRPDARITTLRDFVDWCPNLVRTYYPGMNTPSTDAFDFSRPPFFCHGDLVPENILVLNGHISGIIDWASAGWYPYFWNDWIGRWRNKVPQFQDGRWARMVDIMTEPFPAEVEAFEEIFALADQYL
ncbi:kinase-like domain-containing protein [Favolaschia claudopus]|uniref:Kinase-like domain-containing protein n=1 Tax=Favolaschia claudopus TaxID=2862362 RepID=A0AAW0BBH5_9AGAR